MGDGVSATCNGCGKPIVFAVSRTSKKRVPIDMDIRGADEATDPKGALYYLNADLTECILIVEPRGVWAALRMKDPASSVLIETKGSKNAFQSRADRIGISHFRTCAAAGQFSGRNRK